MPTVDLGSSSAICRRCGKAYGRMKGSFPVSYASLYKGIGYLPYCKVCIDSMYESYLAEHKNQKDCVRQMCRKLDLYWNEALYNNIDKQSTPRTVMTSYIAKITGVKFAGKSYDDTLKESGNLWDFDNHSNNILNNMASIVEVSNTNVDANSNAEAESEDAEDIPDDVKSFWGPGYNSKMYKDLEQRRKYWMSKIPDSSNIDIGQEALIRQICSLEIDINRDRAAGRPIDKSVGALNTLLGSMNLKPVQKSDVDISSDNTPYGVWIKRLEDTRPVSDPDPEFKDVDGIVRYITIWFFGHACKMLGIKNSYCKLYEDAIAELRVNKPEYEDEDDEFVFNSVFSGNDEE